MTYVALLRGINVGGNNKVSMAELKKTFERLDFSNVKTFINSGNIIFNVDSDDQTQLTKVIEAEIEKDFGFTVKVLLRDLPGMQKLVKGIPEKWVNDQTMKCDVMFLWPEIDSKNILKQIPYKPEIEDVIYLEGTVVWRVDRDKITKGRVLKIIGSDVYKKMTIRNPNSVRKILALMQDSNR